MVRIDERDARLLSLVDLRARTTYATMAKQLRISKPAAKRRLERLEQAGVIRRYIAIINLPKLGYTTFKLSLKLSGVDSAELQRFTEHARSLPETGWVLRALGRWDFLIILYARGAHQLEMVYRKLVAPIADKVSKKLVSVMVSFTHLPHDCLLKRVPPVRERISVGGPLEPAVLDELDLQLLNILSRDARSSLISLATALGVTPKTVRLRMRRLEANAILLGYNAVLDTEKLGLEHHKIYVYLGTLEKEVYRQVRNYMTSLPETVLFTEEVSSADLDFDVKVPSTARLQEIICSLRDRFAGVIKDIQTILITDEDVIDYTPHQ